MFSSIPTNFLDVVDQVHNNGWSPLPLYAPHALDHEGNPRPGAGKAPMLSGWQYTCGHRFTADQLRNSVRVHEDDLGGLGLAMGWGGGFGIDIDIDDEILADRVHHLAARVLGTDALVRYGRRPRRMLVFRTSDGSALSSSSIAFGSGHKVELIANGKQLVAFGIHPKTGLPYAWDGDRSPATVALDDVHAVTPEMVEEFFAQLPDVLGPVAARVKTTRDHEREWTPPAAGSSREITATVNGAAFANREAWVGGLGLNHLRRHGRDYTAQATFRAGSNETSLKIAPAFIYDHGMQTGFSPVGLVMAALGVGFLEALQWLDELVGDGSAITQWKARRDAEGAPTEATGEEEDEPFALTLSVTDTSRSGPTISEARALLDAAVGAVFKAVDEYHAAPKDSFPPPRFGIRGREGLGKTRAIADWVDRTSPDHPNEVVIIGVPTIDLAVEAARKFNDNAVNGRAIVFRGRQSKDMAGAAMCDRVETLSKVAAVGGGGRNPCQGDKQANGKRGHCPFYDRCAYRAQRHEIASRDVIAVFVASVVLSTDIKLIAEALTERDAGVRLIVIDESMYGHLVHRFSGKIANMIKAPELLDHNIKVDDGEITSEQARAIVAEAVAAVHRAADITAMAVAGTTDGSGGYVSPEPIGLAGINPRQANSIAFAARILETIAFIIEGDLVTPGSQAGAREERRLLEQLAEVTRLAGILKAVSAALTAGRSTADQIMCAPAFRGGGDQLVAHVRRDLSALAKASPMLFIDADLAPASQMRAMVGGAYREVLDISPRLGPGATHLHIAGARGSISSLTDKASKMPETIRRVLSTVAALAGAERGLVTASKQTIDRVAPGDFDRLTYGKVRGIDAYNGARLVACVGTSVPSPREVEALAAGLFSRPIDRVTRDEDSGDVWYSVRETEVAGIDGSSYTLGQLHHPDPGANTVLASVISEQRQAMGRGRPCDVGPDGRQLIVTVGDAHVPSVPDRVATIHQLDMGEEMFGLFVEGFLPESPAIAGKLLRIAGRAPHHANSLISLIKTTTDAIESEERIAPKRLKTDSLRQNGAIRAQWFGVRIQPFGRGPTASRMWVRAETPDAATHIARVNLEQIGVTLKTCSATGYTLADVGDHLFGRRATEEEVAQFVAPVAPVEPMRLALVTEKDAETTVDYETAERTADVDLDLGRRFVEARECCAIEREQRAEEYLAFQLDRSGLTEEEAIEMLPIRDDEPDVWEGLPREVRDAIEYTEFHTTQWRMAA